MGFVYILKNPSFSDEWVKIGRTDQDDIMIRVRELNRSEATPFGFRIYAIYEVENSQMVEHEIHGLIDDIHFELRARETIYGQNRVKEFFHMSADSAFSVFKHIAILRNDIEKLKLYPPDNEAIKEEIEAATLFDRHERARNTTFEMLEIPQNTELKFLYDESYICRTVTDKNIVEYGNEKFTISKLALKIGRENFGWTGSSVNGFEYFTFEGETLWNRRKRLEEQSDNDENT